MEGCKAVSIPATVLGSLGHALSTFGVQAPELSLSSRLSSTRLDSVHEFKANDSVMHAGGVLSCCRFRELLGWGVCVCVCV